MKRFLFVFYLCVALLTLQASAYSLPYFTYEDGNTVLGTFITSTLTDIQKDDVRTFLDSPYSLIVYTPNDFEPDRLYLMTFSEGESLEFTLRSDGNVDLYNNYFSYSGTAWDFEDDGTLTYRYTLSGTPRSVFYKLRIVGGRAAANIDMVLPTPRSSYVADVTGQLLIRDDGGLFSESDTDNSDDDSGGILGFLSGFWDALKSAFMGLFVPGNGFFTDYFQEIQTVASAKMGGLFSLYNAMLDAFQSLNGDTPSMIFEIPASSMFPSSPLITFNVLGNVSTYVKWVKGILTGIVVLVTAILCYRRLVTLFEQ